MALGSSSVTTRELHFDMLKSALEIVNNHPAHHPNPQLIAAYSSLPDSHKRSGADQSQMAFDILKYLDCEYPNNAKCQLHIGICYYYGIGIEENLEEAAQYFLAALTQGSVTAKCNLARCYIYGEGVEQSLSAGYTLYKEAADAGNVSAKYAVSSCLSSGVGVRKNPILAIQYAIEAKLGGYGDHDNVAAVIALAKTSMGEEAASKALHELASSIPAASLAILAEHLPIDGRASVGGSSARTLSTGSFSHSETGLFRRLSVVER